MEAGKRARMGYLEGPATTKYSCFYIVRRRTIGTRLEGVTLAEVTKCSRSI